MNFCAEFRWRRHRATWWALTQAEETLEGFDAVAKSARAAFVFQFKAASNIVGGRRRYVADHDQMKLLVSLARRVGGGVYYVLPDISTWDDFAATGARIRRACWYLDVLNIPWPRSEPTTVTQPPRPRVSRAHYLDLSPPTHSAFIRSETVEVPVLAPGEFRPYLTPGIGEVEELPRWFEEQLPGVQREALARGRGGCDRCCCSPLTRCWKLTRRVPDRADRSAASGSPRALRAVHAHRDLA